MVVLTLLAAATVHVATGAAFFVVSRRAGQPAAAPGSLLAQRAFRGWWQGMGAYLLIQGVLHGLAAFGYAPLGVHVVMRIVSIPLLVAAVAGLTFHILFLYTGRSSLALPLFVAFGGIAFLFFLATFRPFPEFVYVGEWLVHLDGTGEGPLYRSVYAVIGIAPIAACLGYLSLLPRVQDRRTRYRIALIAGSILLWIGSGLVARLGGSDQVKFVTLSVFGAGAALGVLLAYSPPGWVSRWLDAAPLGRA